MRARLQEQWHHDKQLVIYRRPDPKGAGGAKPVWYYDIKLPNQERIRQQSTKFTDYTDALLYAEQQYRNLSARAATGIKLHAWTFQRIANQAIQYYRDQLEAEMLDPLRFERFERTVKKCLNPYFGDLGKDFVSINTIDIEDWIVWRKRKGKQSTVSTKHIKHGDWIEGSKVATGTLNYELQMLRMVYDYARKKELILPAQIPEIKSLREDQREKNGLTLRSLSGTRFPTIFGTTTSKKYRQTWAIWRLSTNFIETYIGNFGFCSGKLERE